MDHNSEPMTTEERKAFIVTVLRDTLRLIPETEGFQKAVDDIEDRWDDDVNVNRSQMFYEGYQI